MKLEILQQCTICLDVTLVDVGLALNNFLTENNLQEQNDRRLVLPQYTDPLLNIN